MRQHYKIADTIMHTLKKHTEKLIRKLFVVAVCVAIFAAAPFVHAEDDYGTYTTSPIDYGTYTTVPVDYGTYTTESVDYGMYTTSPDYGTYTTSPDYGTYTTSPEPDYGMYTTSPVDYGTYTTSPIDTYTQPYTTANAYVPPDYGTYTTSPVDYGTFTTSPLVYASAYDYYPAYPYGYGSYDYYTYSLGDYYYPSYSYYPSYTPAVYAKSKPEIYKPYVAPAYTDTCVGTNNCNTVYTPSITTNPVTPVIIDNNNTNTNNNTNNNNNVITINNPAPVTTIIKERERSRPEYRQPAYYQPPMYNSPAPYVSLSAVPYTGLELGFWGTVVYWSVLVLWCLFVAYAVVIKRAHTKIVRWFKTFLFGGTTAVAATEVATPINREVVQAPTQTLDKTDDFIMAQILRRA